MRKISAVNVVLRTGTSHLQNQYICKIIWLCVSSNRVEKTNKKENKIKVAPTIFAVDKAGADK